MNSDILLNNLLDYDSYIEDLLYGVDNDVEQPPLYNILKGFHGILQSNINTIMNETNCSLNLNQYNSSIHQIILHKTKECSICLEEITENTVCSMLPCLHTFHNKCIKKWLTMNKSTCPECRMRLN